MLFLVVVVVVLLSLSKRLDFLQRSFTVKTDWTKRSGEIKATDIYKFISHKKFKRSSFFHYQLIMMLYLWLFLHKLSTRQNNFETELDSYFRMFPRIMADYPFLLQYQACTIPDSLFVILWEPFTSQNLSSNVNTAIEI